MNKCRTCGDDFEWGRTEDGWVLLEPLGKDDDLPKCYMDENDVLRADHRDRHAGVPTVNVTRLYKKIPAETAAEHSESIVGRVKRGRRKLKGNSAAIGEREYG